MLVQVFHSDDQRLQTGAKIQDVVISTQFISKLLPLGRLKNLKLEKD